MKLRNPLGLVLAIMATATFVVSFACTKGDTLTSSSPVVENSTPTSNTPPANPNPAPTPTVPEQPEQPGLSYVELNGADGSGRFCAEEQGGSTAYLTYTKELDLSVIYGRFEVTDPIKGDGICVPIPPAIQVIGEGVGCGFDQKVQIDVNQLGYLQGRHIGHVFTQVRTPECGCENFPKPEVSIAFGPIDSILEEEYLRVLAVPFTSNPVGATGTITPALPYPVPRPPVGGEPGRADFALNWTYGYQPQPGLQCSVAGTASTYVTVPPKRHGPCENATPPTFGLIVSSYSDTQGVVQSKLDFNADDGRIKGFITIQTPPLSGWTGGEVSPGETHESTYLRPEYNNPPLMVHADWVVKEGNQVCNQGTAQVGVLPQGPSCEEMGIELTAILQNETPTTITYKVIANKAGTFEPVQPVTYTKELMARTETVTFTMAGTGCVKTIQVNVPALPAECHLNIEKGVDMNSAEPGDKLTYSLHIWNDGTANCTGGGVKIDDGMPTNVQYVNGSATNNGTCHFTGYSGNAVHWNCGTVVPGAEATVTWKGKVINPEGNCNDFRIDNQATAWSNEKGTVSSNVVSTDVDVTCNTCPPSQTTHSVNWSNLKESQYGNNPKCEDFGLQFLYKKDFGNGVEHWTTDRSAALLIVKDGRCTAGSTYYAKKVVPNDPTKWIASGLSVSFDCGGHLKDLSHVEFCGCPVGD